MATASFPSRRGRPRQDHAEAGPDRARLHARSATSSTAWVRSRPRSAWLEGRCVQRRRYESLATSTAAPRWTATPARACRCATPPSRRRTWRCALAPRTAFAGRSGFRTLEKRVGNEMAFLVEGDEEKKITYQDTVAVLAAAGPSSPTAPEWPGSLHGGRRQRLRAERRVPCRGTRLTGRLCPTSTTTDDGHGESLPIFRPPLDPAHIYGERPVGDHRPGQSIGQGRGALPDDSTSGPSTPSTTTLIHAEQRGGRRCG